MPCWVAPDVAAEYWGVSLDRVMADVAAGRVDTWVERELLFVDVMPLGYPDPAPEVKPARAWGRRSLAWTVAGAQTVVTPAERDALLTLDESAFDESAFGEAAAVEMATDSVDEGEGDAEPEPAPDVPESVHDDGEPAPLPDGPEEPAPTMPLVEEPPQWASVRTRVSRLRRPPPNKCEAA